MPKIRMLIEDQDEDETGIVEADSMREAVLAIARWDDDVRELISSADDVENGTGTIRLEIEESRKESAVVMQKVDAMRRNIQDLHDVVVRSTTQKPTPEEVWVRAWVGVASASNSTDKEKATEWADQAARDYQARFCGFSS